MKKFAWTRRATLIAGLLALVCGAPALAMAEGMQATATFSPATVPVEGESQVTIHVVNSTGAYFYGSPSPSALPALPDGLEYTSGPDAGDCGTITELDVDASCDMTATVKATATGSFDWTGDAEGDNYSLHLTSAAPLLVHGDPAAIWVSSGNYQSARVNTAFQFSLEVLVVDSSDVAIPGVEVTFTAPTDGASATFDSTTLQTDADGHASVAATANAFWGNFIVQASVSGVESPAQFELYNIPPPSELKSTVSYSPPVIAPGGQATATIYVKNTSGRVINTMITTADLPALPSGLNMVGQPDVGTCGIQFGGIMNGQICQMTAVVTSTTPGARKWTGNGATNNGSNIYISIADTVGLGVYDTPTSIVVNEGDNQSIPVGDGVETLSVLVKDDNGIAVPGIKVTFTAPSTGASVTVASKSVDTDTDGQAGVNLLANQVAGDYEIEATIDGVSTPAVFHLSNLPGEPASLSVTSGDGQSAEVSTAFAAPLVARVLDASGNPLAGETVTFTAPADGASGTFASDLQTATSDADGYATSATFTANATAGTYSVEASLAGASSATFDLENTAADVDPLPLPAITALSPNAGPQAGGTSVTITGSEFTGATSVTFGGVEADFELVDDTIVAVTPAGSGTVDVLITTPAGTSTAIEASRFSYDTPVDPPDTSADSAELDAVQDTFTPVVAAQSSRSIVGSMTNAIRLGISGGTQTSFSTSEMFLAYGPTPADPATPFDEILVDDSQPLPDNVSIWLDTTGQGILPLSTTPERGWQVNITGGIGMRVTPDLLIGAVAGHERFSYRSEDTGATLSGSGTSLGAYAGWDVGGRLLVSLGVVNTALDYRTDAGAASGTFQASRWLVTGDISGEYSLGDFTVQPSATLLGIWETQDAYIDTLSGVHDEQQFGSATASAGFRISHALPISEDWELAPYVGAYLDAATDATIGDGDATYGVSGRLTAGATFTSADGLRIDLDGDLGGLGTDTVTLSARGNLKSSF